MNLEEFAAKISLTGEWIISYHDASHLPPGDDQGQGGSGSKPLKMIRVGSITVDDIPPELEQGIVPFTFAVDPQDQMKKRFRECWPDALLSKVLLDKNQRNSFTDNLDKYPKTIYGEIADSLIRTRICRPEIDQRDWNALEERRNLILITDTNSIRRGIISYLSDIFEAKPIWVIVPVVSMLELQEASGRAKSDKTTPTLFKLLGKRPMSTSSTRELLLLRKRQVPVEFLEVPPELLRYYGGKEPSEEETAYVLKDRMILEGVKDIIKAKSTAEKICLLSGDFDVVRFAKLENIDAIYVGKGQPKESGEQFYSARYDIYKRGFVACGAHEFLWDLTHVFSFIKADNPTAKRTITLDYYFAGKSVKDWEEDILEVTEQEYGPAV